MGLTNMHCTTTVALALAVAGCGATGRFVPANLRGDTPLAVENLWGGDICRLWVTPPGSTETPPNLLYGTLRGEMPLKVKEKATFNLKPGTYEIGVAGCQAGFDTVRPLSLQGPTYVALGARGTPPPGYTELTVSGNDLQLCTNPGGSMDDGRPCCSQRHHHDPKWGETCD